MSIILVSHDMGIVAETSDEVVVMYAGQVMEQASTEAIFSQPLHPYTVGLLKSIPRMDVRRRAPAAHHRASRPTCCACRRAAPLPSAARLPLPDCSETPIQLRQVEPGHLSACLYPERASAMSRRPCWKSRA